MSCYSGRCDFFDTIEIFGVDNIIQKYKISITGQILPLEVNNLKDLIPYYPYLVAMMTSNKETGGKLLFLPHRLLTQKKKNILVWNYKRY